ncbi:low temperature requirement protein A [Micromonospora sp. NPDC050397]|uniref:low temperature requirement protein A n=1 Tax=Micromonospora sp. NPDC050397 TaxID=3364279 RepID=UPI00384E1A13
MAEAGIERLLLKPKRPHEISFLELFFDLAIIFALIQLSQRLLGDFDGTNSAQTLVLVAAIWWLWVAAVRTADWFNPGAPFVQGVITMVMFGGLVAAAAVPRAFGEHGLVFAGAYVTSHVGRHLAIFRALRGHPLQARSLRAIVWFSAAGVLWIIGAFLPATPRLVLWSVAIVVDYAGVPIGWPVPGLGRVSNVHMPVRGSHLAERHRQVFIVGLGELILASGLTLSQDGTDLVRTVAFLLAFAIAVLMLWGYLLPHGLDLEGVLDRRPPPVAILCSYAHGLMIAGIVVTAMADDLLIGKPLGETEPGWVVAMIAGPVLYLAGRAFFVAVVFQHRIWRAPVGMAILAALLPVLLDMPLLAVAGVVTAVLLGIVLSGNIGESSTRRLGSLSERLLRKREHPEVISFYELFFDLALIFALVRLSQRLLNDLSLINVAQTLVLLAAIWWIWVATAWSTDWFNSDEPYLQRLVLGIMFAGLLMAAAVPGAYDDNGLLFAGAYVAIHLGRGLLIVPALRGSPLQMRSARVLIWFAVSAVPWLVGAFLPAGPRMLLWAVAIALDGVIAFLGWPLPKLGSVPHSQLRVVGAHIAERYRQIYIVALGVPIIVTGLTYSDSGFDYARTSAFVITSVSTLLLLWVYVLPFGRNLGTLVDNNAPRAAVVTAYTHGILVAAVVAIAVGDAMLIEQPLDGNRMAPSLVLIGGIALHIVGRSMLTVEFGVRRPWRSVAALLVLIGIAPGLLLAPPLVMAVVVNLVLLFVVLVYRSIKPRGSPAPT